MASSSGKKSMFIKPEDEVSVVPEDQEKLNKFVCLTANLHEVKEDIKLKKKEMDDLEEAESNILMSEQDQPVVPFTLGENFFDMDPENLQTALLERKEKIEMEIEELEIKKNKIKEERCELKSALYGKFGDTINLESD